MFYGGETISWSSREILSSFGQAQATSYILTTDAIAYMLNPRATEVGQSLMYPVGMLGKDLYTSWNLIASLLKHSTAS